MIIPTQVTVGRQRYKVLQPETVMHGRYARRGDIHYLSTTIRVAWVDKGSGRPFTTRQRSETFWHEMTHAILHDMGSHLANSEKFVVAFSTRLNKAVLSAKLP